MNHELYKEYIQLQLYGELNGKEKKELELHLLACEECNMEMSEMQQFYSSLSQHHRLEMTSEMLDDARFELRNTLRGNDGNQSLWDWLFNALNNVFAPQYRIAFGTVAILTIGFFLGYLVFVNPAKPQQPLSQTTPSMEVSSNTIPALQNDAKIGNIRFLNPDQGDGNVEFTFDAITPMKMKGNVNDGRIQKILTYALLNEQNPGVRLRSVNAMATEQLKPTDNDLKDALITALTTDENIGVRREAMNALKRFPLDEQIKHALLSVLKQDSNSSMRIEAINTLESFKSEKNHFDEDIVNVLKEKVQTETNNYIKLRAKAVLQVVNK